MDAPGVQGSEQAYIVRVRPDDGDAVVEEVRSRQRLHVDDLSQLGPLIADWSGLQRPIPARGARSLRELVRRAADRITRRNS